MDRTVETVCLPFVTLAEVRAGFLAGSAGAMTRDLRAPERSFRRLTLPRCGRCSGCPVRGQCCYPLWKEVGRASALAAGTSSP
jgi:hypothetical protein